MPKSVKICLAAVIAVFAAAVIAAVLIMRPKDSDHGKYVRIISDGQLLYELDLEKEPDRVIRIDYENGWNEVTVKDGEIFVSDADCPDRTCIKTGVLRYEYLPIICLPHKLEIRFSEVSAS